MPLILLLPPFCFISRFRRFSHYWPIFISHCHFRLSLFDFLRCRLPFSLSLISIRHFPPRCHFHLFSCAAPLPRAYALVPRQMRRADCRAPLADAAADYFAFDAIFAIIAAAIFAAEAITPLFSDYGCWLILLPDIFIFAIDYLSLFSFSPGFIAFASLRHTPLLILPLFLFFH